MLKLLLIAASLTIVLGVAINYPRAICDQYDSNIAINVISGVPSKSTFFQVKGNVPSLIEKLIDNATSIRENIVDTFSCHNRVYGYYADQDNSCQIFHICVPMQQLFPELYCAEDIFHFSFICPKHTIFSQEAMVCDWADNAFPCSEADKLYDRNNLFFVVPEEDVQRESAPDVTTPASSQRESMCCSSRSQTIEARSKSRDRSQLSSSTPSHKKSRTTVESPKMLTTQKFPQTTFPTIVEDIEPLPTTSMIVEMAKDITTWPSTNLEPVIFSDSKQTVFEDTETIVNAKHESPLSAELLTTFEGEPEQFTLSTFLPDTTLPELTPTESVLSEYYPTFSPNSELIKHSQEKQIPTIPSRLKIRRSHTSQIKPPIVMFIEGLGFKVISDY